MTTTYFWAQGWYKAHLKAWDTDPSDEQNLRIVARYRVAIDRWLMEKKVTEVSRCEKCGRMKRASVEFCGRCHLKPGKDGEVIHL
jgi:hypothetical protein